MSRKSLTILVALTLVVALCGWTLAAQQKKAGAPEVQSFKVTADAKGFTPSSLDLKIKVPAKITFTRTSNDTCATAVALPDYKITKDLPLNKAVDVEFTPEKAGTFTFACGMNMFKGKLVIK